MTMAMSAAFSSPNPLFSLHPKAPRPPSCPCMLPPIRCSKRSRKLASKPKLLHPSKHNKHQLPHEDFLPGIGAGGSTLTALQPRLDDDDPELQQRQRLELRIAQERMLESFRRASNSASQRDEDPLARYTLASDGTADVRSSTLTDVGNGPQRIAEGDGAEKVEDDEEEDFEWVEIGEEDDEEEEDRYEYWEGDLGPMTEEEEGELLREAEMELAELEKQALNKKGASRAFARHPGGAESSGRLTRTARHLLESTLHITEEEEEEDSEEEDRFEYWEGDLPPMTAEEEAELLREAKMELEQLEAEKRARQKNIFRNDLSANGENSARRQHKIRNYGSVDEETLMVGCSPQNMASSGLREAATFSADESRNASTIANEIFNLKKDASPVVDDANPSKSNEERHHGKTFDNEISSEVPDDDEDEDAFIARVTKEIEEEARGERKWGTVTDEKSQKRGIPAVMRCFDRAKIFVKAGNGGNGIVAFRREKYVPFGGPSGGSGGKGGDIYMEADPSMNSLLSFRKGVHFRAGRGSHGQGKSQDGAVGLDCTVEVPLGTVVREAGVSVSRSGNILLELTSPGQRELLLPGGRGGRGNVAFKTGRNKTPQLAENGEEGAEMWLELELKLVADVGIIGVPNAGKSTLLSVISAAQPAIAAYPFTTLLPNLGVVPVGLETSIVVADLPGLLEGAHLGIGLGHEFLRHTERCCVLVHVVDGMSQQPEQEYEAVRLELQLFNPLLSEKPFIVAFNKMDIPEAAARWETFQAYLTGKKIAPICISAATKMGTMEVVNRAYTLLQSVPRLKTAVSNKDEELEIVGEIIRKQRSAPIEQFEIFGDVESRTWQVQGVGLERFTQMTNWEYFEALRRFQYVLNASGVNKALKEHGVREGDNVIVGEMEFIWHDSEDIISLDWKRSFRGSKKVASLIQRACLTFLRATSMPSSLKNEISKAIPVLLTSWPVVSSDTCNMSQKRASPSCE